MDGRIIFTADAHLSPESRALGERFLKFLEWARGAEALYILGDLFEYWTGVGLLRESGFMPVIDGIRKLSESGTSVYFSYGNRDFLVGKREKEAMGLAEIFDAKTITVGGLGVHLSHGDLFCGRDRHYQVYRRVIRSWFMRRILAFLPNGFANRLAGKFRRRSEDIVKHKGPRMTSVDWGLVRETLGASGADVLICGHVHRRSEESLEVDGRERRVYILGGWGDGYGDVVVFREGKFGWADGF